MPRPTPSRSLRHLVLLALLPFAAGCDQLAEVLELPNPSKVEAEGRAAGLPKGRALELLQDMTDRLGPALDRTLLAVGDQVPAAVSEPIASDATQRAAQMRDLL